MNHQVAPTQSDSLASAAQRYLSVRNFSLQIAEPLSPEDCAMQTMPDVSPTRWHLAHTTWFFETFILRQVPGYQPFDEAFEYLFNSYYNSVGQQLPRDRRGTLSRPGLIETLDYRSHVDEAMQDLLSEPASQNIGRVLELGLQHEQQHQELMLTDIKHVLFSHPLLPSYSDALFSPIDSPNERYWVECEAKLADFGHEGTSFAFDNECPRHTSYLQEHCIASTCVTNGEFLEFLDSGGYQQPEHWLSLGWSTVQEAGWKSPLYWLKKDGQWFEFTLAGLQSMELNRPVCHISFFEADAFARWAGKRLPTEFEWESFAINRDADRSLFANALVPNGLCVHPGADLESPLGNMWQWTSSPYLAYPGYKAPSGALGEYNGKFMCNQFVLRGGSCATSSDHIRITYRNFFPPEARWQFSGLRLAE